MFQSKTRSALQNDDENFFREFQEISSKTILNKPCHNFHQHTNAKKQQNIFKIL